MMYMRCVSFCTAASYKLPAITTFFKANGYLIKSYRKAMRLNHPNETGDVFIFPHGCFVTWGLKKSTEQKLLQQINDFAIDPLQKIEKNYFVFVFGEKTEMVVNERFNIDVITLGYDDSQIKFAISYGLAQSIKLEFFEESVQKTIEKNEHLAEELAKKGTILLSRKAISKRMGEIFHERSSINLNSEYLGVPEYFWEHPGIENYYIMSEKFLDISRRVAVLNQKLDVLHELFEVLTGQLQHRYSSFLEFIIILLILSEIIINFFHIN